MIGKSFWLNLRFCLPPIIILSCSQMFLCDRSISLTQPHTLGLPNRTFSLSQLKTQPDKEIQIIEKINQLRIDNHLEPLFVNNELTKIARDYSQLMAETQCFQHQCQGRVLENELERIGIKYTVWTENLWTGYASPTLASDVIQSWLSDQGHRGILLNSKVSETGVGIWIQGDRYYITQVSMKPLLAKATPTQSSPPSASLNLPLSREAFETKLRLASPSQAVSLVEKYWLQEFQSQLDPANIQAANNVFPPEAISTQLEESNRETHQRSVLIYAVAMQNQLNLYLTLPSDQDYSRKDLKQKSHLIQQYSIPVSKTVLLQTVRAFNRTVRDTRLVNTENYLPFSQQLYQWLILPLLPTLKAHKINNLLFSLDEELRSLPLAALKGEQGFLIEQYSLGLIPSFGLTNKKFLKLKSQPLLAMGISESVENQPPLPGAALEVNSLSKNFWSEPVQKTLNRESTLNNFQIFTAKRQYGIVHLATHASFRPGRIDNSFIQFWNQRLTFKQISAIAQALKWTQHPSVELLVLSACQTAVGSREAELGFAGLAIQSGVKSALASLWSINDQATVGLMLNFYKFLVTTPTKAEALRQAQLAMLRGEVKLQDGNLILSANRQVPWPEAESTPERRVFSHPHFWSAYTLVGNWK